jgi:hypothetical protein
MSPVKSMQKARSPIAPTMTIELLGYKLRKPLKRNPSRGFKRFPSKTPKCKPGKAFKRFLLLYPNKSNNWVLSETVISDRSDNPNTPALEGYTTTYTYDTQGNKLTETNHLDQTIFIPMARRVGS